MINEFNTIISKNFAVYGKFQDFSFAKSRSADDLNLKIAAFFKEHFSGNF
jgi:hypothetical protein